MGKSKNCLLMFRIPATAKGYRLVTQMRTMLNTDSYKMRTLFTGKRPKGTPQATTLKKNAESIRVYIDSILEDGTNPRINDIYENGITTGKAREQFANEERFQKSVDYTKKLLAEIITLKKDLDKLNKELDEQAKKIDDSPSYNSLKVERDELRTKLDSANLFNTTETLELKKEIARLNTKVDNEVCEGSCVSQEDYDSILTENIALNKSLATAYDKVIKLEESINVQNRSVSRTSDDVDLDKFIDMGFSKWVEQQSWHKRWLYKIGSIAWRDFAFMMLAFWSISMIVLLTLKVEGVIN